MANGHGGRRPGAGRPPSEARSYQARMRAIFEERVRPEDWQKIVDVAMAQAKSGDKAAREWLAAWIVGKVPDEVKQTGTVELKVTADDLHEAVKRAKELSN